MKLWTLPAVWCICGAAIGADVSVVIKTATGEVKGTIADDAWSMTTSFGSAKIEPSHVRSVTFGESDRVVTDDRTSLAGRLAIDTLEVSTTGATLRLTREELRSLSVYAPAPLEPGTITAGRSASGLEYSLRAPRHGSPRTAVVILHGSNMNARDYVQSIVGAWPSLAEDFLLVGIDGEQEGQGSTAENPVRNYTYVNYVGKSTYRGYPGTDRESPALVSEAIAELRERHGLERVFVGGHSQGGFLTYSLYMNFPDLIDGAFPISGGLIFQCEPRAYDNEELIERQKRTPLAVVHAVNDPVVGFEMGRYAYEAFDDAGYPALSLVTDEHAGHMFMNLPVERAVRWLDALTTADAAALAVFCEQASRDGRWRDALAAAARGAQIGGPDLAPRFALVERAAAEAQESALAPLATGPDRAGNAWVGEFLEIRERFGPLAPRTALHAKFDALRKEHDAAAEPLFTQAGAKFQARDPDAGYALYQRIVDEYPCATRARACARWLKNRK